MEKQEYQNKCQKKTPIIKVNYYGMPEFSSDGQPIMIELFSDIINCSEIDCSLDYLKILGLKENDSNKIIQKKLRDLKQQHHPDKKNDKKAAYTAFKLIGYIGDAVDSTKNFNSIYKSCFFQKKIDSTAIHEGLREFVNKKITFNDYINNLN